MATTVNTLERYLQKFVEPNEVFIDVLNQVLPRVYNMGYWRDLVFETTIQTDHAYIALPRGAESVIAGMVEGAPTSSVRAQWHDYKIAGLTASGGPDALFGLVDDGFDPTIVDLDRANETYQFEVTPISPATTLPNSGKVIIVYEDEDNDKKEYTFSLDGSASMTTVLGSGDRAIRVYQIRFEDVLSITSTNDTPLDVRVKALAVSDTGTDLTIAEGRGDEIARYRRYRVSHSQRGESKYVYLLLKRAFVPLLRKTELVHLGNIDAIKHAMLGRIAEDQADTDRATYHWGVCRGLLAEELDSYRGAAKPAAILDLTGHGGSPVENLM